MQTIIAKFSKAGHSVKVAEAEVFGESGCVVFERRYAVFSRAPGKELRECLYEGPDAKRRALEQFEFTKSVIDLNH